jgi:hypothetical protein
MGRTTVILLLGIFFLGTAFRVCTICRFCICIVFFRGLDIKARRYVSIVVSLTPAS